jgi:hypothetical protein
LPPALQPTGQFPYNGNFEIPADGLPFNWIINPVLGADVKVVPSEDGKGRVLRAQFSGARVQFSNVKQLMLLAPGHYRLAGQVKSDDLRTTRGLWWRLSCVNGSAEKSLAQTDLVSGTHPWSDFQVDFEVPAAGCAFQWLRLELPARIASEHQIEGQVWYRDLRITPVPPLSTG